MYKIDDLMAVLQSFAPLELSHKMIEKGSYDNSGLIIESSREANKILFSLDLSKASIEKAIELNCDTIITHHPAIYNPIKNISLFGEQKEIALVIKNDISVVSMHLNLDIADEGIDQELCQGLGGKEIEILSLIDQSHGYGRKAKVKKQSASEFLDKVKEIFGSQKILLYGQKEVNIIASFCGSGASEAVEILDDCSIDTIITSDVQHHHLKEIIESGKNLLLIPHYVSEQYGFNKFYQKIKEKLKDKTQIFYFLDNRFM